MAKSDGLSPRQFDVLREISDEEDHRLDQAKARGDNPMPDRIWALLTSKTPIRKTIEVLLRKGLIELRSQQHSNFSVVTRVTSDGIYVLYRLKQGLCASSVPGCNPGARSFCTQLLGHMGNHTDGHTCWND